jgi:nuclear protein localization family protein 4
MFEPEQQSATDGAILSASAFDSSFDSVLKIAKEMGLECGVMCYTDMHSDPVDSKLVQCRRSKDSFFLSSAEIVFIAKQQLRFPFRVPGGVFGSRFVCVVVSGDEQGQVGFRAYQLSNQCLSLVKGGLVAATTSPTLMSLTPTPNSSSTGGSSSFVAQVFYKGKNEYGAVVTLSAQPFFPVDFFIVTLTEGFPSNPTKENGTFAIENRVGKNGSGWDERGAWEYLSKVGAESALRDLHFVYWMSKCGFFTLVLCLKILMGVYP